MNFLSKFIQIITYAFHFEELAHMSLRAADRLARQGFRDGFKKARWGC